MPPICAVFRRRILPKTPQFHKTLRGVPVDNPATGRILPKTPQFHKNCALHADRRCTQTRILPKTPQFYKIALLAFEVRVETPRILPKTPQFHKTVPRYSGAVVPYRQGFCRKLLNFTKNRDRLLMLDRYRKDFAENSSISQKTPLATAHIHLPNCDDHASSLLSLPGGSPQHPYTT